MESGDIAARLPGDTWSCHKEPTGSPVRGTQSGEYPVLHSVDELDILRARRIDEVPYLVWQMVGIGVGCLPVPFPLYAVVVPLHRRKAGMYARSLIGVAGLPGIGFAVMYSHYEPCLIFPASSVVPSVLTPVNRVPAAVENPLA